jgi:hypothetical protein
MRASTVPSTCTRTYFTQKSDIEAKISLGNVDLELTFNECNPFFIQANLSTALRLRGCRASVLILSPPAKSARRRGPAHQAQSSLLINKESYCERVVPLVDGWICQRARCLHLNDATRPRRRA